MTQRKLKSADIAYIGTSDITNQSTLFGTTLTDVLNAVTSLKEYQFSTFGQLTYTAGFSQNEKIMTVPFKRNIDTLKLTPIGGGTDINIITTGGTTVALPVNVALGEYRFTMTYSVGTSQSFLTITTQKQ